MYVYYFPPLLQIKSEIRNLLMSAYRVRRLIRFYDAPDVLQRIDPWGSCIDEYIVISYLRQTLTIQTKEIKKTIRQLKKIKQYWVVMDKRLTNLGFYPKIKFKNIYKKGTIENFLVNLNKNLEEFKVGFKSSLKILTLDYFWKISAYQWFNDISTKQYIELFNLQLRLSKSRKARNIRRRVYADNGYRRIALTVTEGCQTLGTQVTSNKDFGHPYHLVNPSILPFSFSLTLFCTIQSILGLFMYEEFFNLFSALSHSYFMALNVATILTWIFEVYSEEQRGAHTLEVQQGFRYAILLFISSELMLFISFFWAFFHFSLSPSSYTGLFFIPEGLVPFYWWRIPMLNTLLLLSSGLALTITHLSLVEQDKLFKVQLWVQNISFFALSSQPEDRTVFALDEWTIEAKHCIAQSINSNNLLILGTSGLIGGCRYAYDNLAVTVGTFALEVKEFESENLSYASIWMLDTVMKGLVFMSFQAFEYVSSMFTIVDSIYGAVFFVLTGLHGIHVIIGVIFLFAYLAITLGQNLIRDFYWTNIKLPLLLVSGSVPLLSFKFNFWTHRIAFDGSAWYWHFVDVVWFLVFVLIYWWAYTSV